MESKPPANENRIRKTLSRIYDEQPAHVKEYLARYKDNPKSRVFAPLAEAYRKQGRLDDAIEICAKGVSEHPDFHGGRVAYARCLIEKGEFETSKAQLDHVLNKVPENLLGQRLMGETLLNLKDIPGAIHHFKMALMLSPEDVALADKIHQLEKANPEAMISSQADNWESDLDPSQGIQTTPASEWESEVEASEKPATEVLSPQQVSMQMRREKNAREREFSPRIETPQYPFSDSETEIGIAKILGFGEEELEEEEDSFRIEHVSEVFAEIKEEKEITTETLGDLYLAQGQFEKALRIFEKIHATRPSEKLNAKMENCLSKLGIHEEESTRKKKIELLEGLLGKVAEPPPAEI